MLSLHQTKESKKICDIVRGKRKVETVHWHPRFNEKYKNSFENLDDINDEYFRDMFEISPSQASEFLSAIENGETIEKQKFFQVKRYVKEMLQIEMDLGGTRDMFQVNFKPKKQFTPHFLVVGSTASGKSYWAKEMILRNLKGKKEDRRQFVIISAQYDTDKTLAELRQEKYHKWLIGFDCGEDGLLNSEFDNPEDYFQYVKTRIENSEPGTVVFADDFRDTCFSEQMRRYIDRGLRVLRHKQVTLILVLHSLRSGVWSSQAHNSVGYMVIFPRSQKNKIIHYFNQELAIPLKEARELTRRFAADSRVLLVHKQMPECLIGDSLLRLL